MSELLLDIGRRFLLGQENRGIGMPEIMESNPTQARLLKALVKDPFAQVVRVEMISLLAAEDQLRHLFPAPLQGLFLPFNFQIPQSLRQLVGHVHPSRSVILG
ncbi:MAG: hypothetical protein C4576_35850 [Desulfobacteraceae bacterium]|nr:MAG: hypothetical protein C4576_35850 [Desulfobacteraceae bacterium]